MISAALMLALGAHSAKAACSVTKDDYGKSKYVWDFGIEAQAGGATYYLDAKDGTTYTTNDPGYGSKRRYYAWAKVIVDASRSIKSTAAPDGDKGAGVILGADGSSSQGLLEFYAPVSGTLELSGKYISNLTIIDKSNNNNTLTTSGSAVSVVSGHHIQIYVPNTKKAGTGIATMTLTPADWGSDVVAEGTMDFSATEVFQSADQPGTSGSFQISSKGYKSVSGTTAVSDALIAKANGESSVIIDAAGENRGLKLRSGSEIDYTTTKNGYLTITYNYNASNITWYNKGTNTTLGTGQTTIYLLAGQRAQGCCAASKNVSIKSITFISSVEVTISAAGYSTYASIWPLDLSSLPDGLTAWYVSATSGDKATLAQATQAVPAKEGLLLKGTAGATYSIPVTSPGTSLSGNLLKGVTGETTVTTGNYIFGYITRSGDTPTDVGFYAVAEGGYSLGANKAYLQGNGSQAKSRMLSFDFGDDAAGISATPADKAETDGRLYNLSGQLVTADYKGIVIKNGKKYLNK